MRVERVILRRKRGKGDGESGRKRSDGIRNKEYRMRNEE